MILFLIRLALIGLATSLTALGIADVSADGEVIAIRVGPFAEFLNDYALGAGGAVFAAWFAMWRQAVRSGGAR